jgi:hypothetical protein
MSNVIRPKLGGGTDTGDSATYFENTSAVGPVVRRINRGSGTEIYINVIPDKTQTGGEPPNTGGKPPIDLREINIKVNILTWFAGGAAGALVGLYFILSGQIEDRSKSADVKISGISEQVTELRIALVGQAADIKAILERLDTSKSAENSRADPPK